MKFAHHFFLGFDEKKFSFPKNFPADLYLNANKRTQKHVKKWVVVLDVLGGYSGTNNLLDLLELWNKKHPEYKTSLKSFYRNKARLKNGGWEAFSSWQDGSATPTPTQLSTLFNLVVALGLSAQSAAKQDPPTQATA